MEKKLQIEIKKLRAAARTLENLGYAIALGATIFPFFMLLAF